MGIEFGPSVQTNWGEFWYLDAVARLVLAALLGLTVGIERERREHAAGMRTHAIVALSAAMFMLVSAYGAPLVPEGLSYRSDPMRIAAQVVSGIGFLGAGVIFMRRNAVRGLTTAASVWAVCGIGLAAGSGMPVIAVAATVLILVIQGGLRPVERQIFAHRESRHRILIDADNALDLLPMIRAQLANSHVSLRSIEFDRDAPTDNETLQLSLDATTSDVVALIHRLDALQGIRHVTWRQGASQLSDAGSIGVRATDDDTTDH